MLALVIAVSVYLAQRTFFVAGNMAATQAEVFGLSFSYITLSLVWPIILGVFCSIYVVLGNKRMRLLDELQRQGLKAESTSLLDVYSFEVPRGAGSRFLLAVIRFLPLTSISIVALANLSVLLAEMRGQSYTGRQASHSLPQEVWLTALLVQAAGIVVAVRLIWPFHSAFRGSSRSEVHKVAATSILKKGSESDAEPRPPKDGGRRL